MPDMLLHYLVKLGSVYVDGWKYCVASVVAWDISIMQVDDIFSTPVKNKIAVKKQPTLTKKPVQF